MKVSTSIFVTVLALVLTGAATLAVATRPAEGGISPALQSRLQRLPQWGTVIYITAHPDDESAGTLTYLARGLHQRVVLLCLTRGEGGQNQTGSELGEELGWVRTRELQRAVAGYGAEVRFTGAVDFGYSKSVEETLRLWDADALVGELVRQIRELKPVAIISNWSGTERDSAGQHRAAGVLTRKAFALAGDPNAFPEQLARGLLPWQPRYFLIRGRSDDDQSFEVPVRQPSPVPGKTFEELGWEAFQNHRSQGMHRFKLADVRRFIRRYRLRVEATLRQGPPAPTSAADLAPDLAALPDLFPSLGWLENWRERLAQATALARESVEQLEASQPDQAALKLVQAAGLLAALRREFPSDGELPLEAGRAQAWVADKEEEFLQAAAAVAGLQLQALTDRATVTPGERVWVGLALKVTDPEVAQAVGFEPGGLQLVAPDGWRVEPLLSESTPSGQRAEFALHIPENADPQTLPVPVARARARLRTGRLQVTLEAPVLGLAATTKERRGLARRLDPRRLLRLQPQEASATARLEPLNVCPAVTLAIEPKLRLLPAQVGETTRDFQVHLQAHRSFGQCSAWFNVPAGWYTPVPKETVLAQPGATSTLRFPLTLPAKIVPGRHELRVQAGHGVETFGLSRRRIEPGPNRADEPSSPTFIYEPASATVQVVNVNVPAGLHIGYIGFSDDPVPRLLAGLGITVTMLDERALAQVPLEIYDAVVVSNRMYDALADLGEQTPRLLDYVQAGGVLVVEHQGRRWDPAKFAPFPGAKSGNPRVTDETAAVRLLAPEHPVLSFPNRIGDQDWQGWVQERGLYFWESWSEEYTPLVETADPGEEPQQGALLYARHGQGAYIYCGLALFRQVRAGVPGGVRLYVNLLSQGRALKKNSSTTDEDR